MCVHITVYRLPLYPTTQSIYIRFKRKHRTVFISCEPGEPLSELCSRVCQLVDKEQKDVQFYEYVTEEKQRLQEEAEAKQLAAREAVLKAKKGKDGKRSRFTQEEKVDLGPTPYDTTLTVAELGLDNDDILLFAYRTENGGWEPLEAEGVVEPPSDDKEELDEEEEQPEETPVAQEQDAAEAQKAE
jgi:hypothetical protein